MGNSKAVNKKPTQANGVGYTRTDLTDFVLDRTGKKPCEFIDKNLYLLSNAFDDFQHMTKPPRQQILDLWNLKISEAVYVAAS